MTGVRRFYCLFLKCRGYISPALPLPPSLPLSDSCFTPLSFTNSSSLLPLPSHSSSFYVPLFSHTSFPLSILPCFSLATFSSPTLFIPFFLRPLYCLCLQPASSSPSLPHALFFPLHLYFRPVPFPHLLFLPPSAASRTITTQCALLVIKLFHMHVYPRKPNQLLY